ncbi:hypothetical protein QJQ45_030056, partial [Haematococcus lacustris]
TLIKLERKRADSGLQSMQDVEVGGDRSVAASLDKGELGRTRATSHRPSREGPHREACGTLIHSWLSRKFIMGVAILFPVATSFYVTWWFLQFFDNFFSPLYYHLFRLHVFGLGFMTSMVRHAMQAAMENNAPLHSYSHAFILAVGVFFSSWLGSVLLGVGEWLIKRLPLVRHIYSASKQVSAALNPDNEAAKAFQECVLIRHPRQGEYAWAFITGRTVLQAPHGDTRLVTVYVPTNHVYVGDVFMLEEADVIHTNLSVREGLEIVISVGMAVPPTLIALDANQSRQKQLMLQAVWLTGCCMGAVGACVPLPFLFDAH